VIVDATHTKILKPDPGSYALALGGLKLPARDVLFVDDQFRNIAGAVAAGMQTQYFDIRDVQGNIAAIAARLNLDPKGDA
jgi:putative hydrolase of the HAD superfamily